MKNGLGEGTLNDYEFLIIAGWVSLLWLQVASVCSCPREGWEHLVARLICRPSNVELMVALIASILIVSVCVILANVVCVMLQ